MGQSLPETLSAAETFQFLPIGLSVGSATRWDWLSRAQPALPPRRIDRTNCQRPTAKASSLFAADGPHHQPVSGNPAAIVLPGRSGAFPAGHAAAAVISAAGGWYRDDFSLMYRPAGHGDGFFRTWLDASGAAESGPARRLFTALTAPQAPGRCIKCHSVGGYRTGRSQGQLARRPADQRAQAVHPVFPRHPSQAAHRKGLSDLSQTGHPIGLPGRVQEMGCTRVRGQLQTDGKENLHKLPHRGSRQAILRPVSQLPHGHLSAGAGHHPDDDPRHRRPVTTLTARGARCTNLR